MINPRRKKPHDNLATIASLNHPAFPLFSPQGNQLTIFSLVNLKISELLQTMGTELSSSQLENYIIDANSDSPLEIKVCRRIDDLILDLENEQFIFALVFQSNGDIRVSDEASPDQTLPLEAIFYLLHSLIHHEKCPFPTSLMEKSWAFFHRFLNYYANFHHFPDPITFKGIILKSDLLKSEELEVFGSTIPVKKSLSPYDVISDRMREEQDLTILPDNVLLRELFDLVDLGRSLPSWMNHSNRNNLRLFSQSSLSFYFSDGVSLELKDILYHPYSTFITNDIFSADSPNEFFDHGALWSDKLQYYYSDSRIRRIVCEFANNFVSSKNYKHQKTNLYFSPLDAEGTNPLIVVAVDDVKNIGSAIANDCTWKIEGNSIIGQLKTEVDLHSTKTLPVNKNSLESGVLILSGKSESPIVSLVKNTFLKTQSDVLSLKKFFELHESSTHRFLATFRDGVTINAPLIRLKHILPQIADPQALTVPMEDIKIELHANELENNVYSFGLNIEISLRGDNGEIQNVFVVNSVPRFLYQLLHGMFYGLGDYFIYKDRDQLALKSQGETRKNDLKLLRHAGAFKVLLSEVFHYNSLDEKLKPKYKAFQEDLLKKIRLLVIGQDNTVGFSSKTERAVKEVINDLCKPNREIETYLLSSNQNIYEINLSDVCKVLIDGILNWLIPSFGEDILKKSQSKELDLAPLNLSAPDNLLVTRQQNPTTPIKLFSSQKMLNDMIVTFATRPVALFINGKKLETFDEHDLKSILHFSESSDDDKIDWFGLHPKIFLKGIELSYEQLQDLKEKNIIVHQGVPYYINYKGIPKLSYLDRFWAKLLNMKANSKNGLSQKFVHKELSMILEVLSLRQAGIAISENPQWEKIAANFDMVTSSDKNLLTDLKKKGFTLPLKQYQETGTEWMLKIHHMGLGGILADDMGLGKTIQAIGFLEGLRMQEESEFVLIVVPTSLVFNWKSEIQKFAPSLEVEIFEAKNKSKYAKEWKVSPPKILLITYGLMAEHEDFLIEFHWKTIIFDEAQNLKNLKSQRTGAARKLKAQSIFCLTGTPMENHFGEFYSLIDLCVPGALENYSDFMKSFNLKKIDTANEEIAFLKNKIVPLVLRRLKKDVLVELPEKVESTILIPFEKKQKEIYRNIAISWNDKVKSIIETGKNQNTQLQMLTALLRLRQVCSHPKTIENFVYENIPPKFELLLNMLEELYERNESILIFSNFLSTLFEIENLCKQKNYSTSIMHGGLSSKDRQKMLTKFNERDGASILIMTLKTGGVGLNLTKANYIFHIEPWWNPASENQATDRAHRMGQTKNVQVYRYIMKDSVEEKIQELKAIKGRAFDALFSSIEDHSHLPKTFDGKLSAEDFQYLLS